MIDEKMLFEAAEEANNAFIHELPDENDCTHQFSDDFEQKMKRQMARGNHPKIYRFMKRVAGFLLIILIGTGSVMTFNTEARSTFSDWVKQIYEEYITYRYAGEKTALTNVDYQISALPDGYEEVECIKFYSNTEIIYENHQKEQIHFYYYPPSSGSISVFGEDGERIPVSVGKYNADFYLFDNPEELNSIIWIDEKRGMFFCIDGAFNQEEMIKLAESITEK